MPQVKGDHGPSWPAYLSKYWRTRREYPQCPNSPGQIYYKLCVSCCRSVVGILLNHKLITGIVHVHKAACNRNACDTNLAYIFIRGMLMYRIFYT